MKYRLRDIPALLKTPIGRARIKHHLRHRAWPLYRFAAHRRQRSMKGQTRTVAVIGSFAKSTTVHAVSSALGVPRGRDLEHNGWTSVAAAMLAAPRGQSHVVIEIGIDGPGQMEQHRKMLEPDIVVVTAIGLEHHRTLGSIEEIRTEKAAMLRDLPEDALVVFNGDNEHARWMAGQTRARTISYGTGAGNDVRAENVRLDWPHGTRFSVAGREIFTRLVGRDMVYPILAALAVASHEGRPASFDNLLPFPGRMQPLPLANGAIVLRDDYKSTVETIDSALDALAEIPARRKLIALGNVSEPVGSQGPVYRRLGARVAEIADFAVFVSGTNQRYIAGATRAGMPRERIVDAGRDHARATEALRAELREGDVLLVKGRDTERLDRIAHALAGETVACELTFCDSPSVRCDQCSMMARGWEGLRVML